ncbi:hypothetical protein BC828DRAFT_377388 [Blastocladiella britannica]|nr:hypothetical protein BC828DRAFT_377388 [Blastocladiella britannica]
MYMPTTDTTKDTRRQQRLHRKDSGRSKQRASSPLSHDEGVEHHQGSSDSLSTNSSSTKDPQEEGDVSYHCRPCQKTFAHPGALAIHLRSRQHSRSPPPSPTLAPAEPTTSDSDGEVADSDDDDDDDLEDEDDFHFCPLCPGTAMYTPHSMAALQFHLLRDHSFRIPYAEHLVPGPGGAAALIEYLHSKIHDLHHCLHCHAPFYNPAWVTTDADDATDADDIDLAFDLDDDDEFDSDNEDDDAVLAPEATRAPYRSGLAALAHMRAVGHASLRLECGAWREYAEFYARDAPFRLAASSIRLWNAATPQASSSSKQRSTTTIKEVEHQSGEVRAPLVARVAFVAAQCGISRGLAAKVCSSRGMHGRNLAAIPVTQLRHLAKEIASATNATSRGSQQAYARASERNCSTRPNVKPVVGGVRIMLH